MFRRIECISPSFDWVELGKDKEGKRTWKLVRLPSSQDVKGGIMHQGSDYSLPEDLRFAATDAWYCMPGPKRRVGKGKFFFTEKGWEEYGRATVNLMQTAGERYRIVKVKEDAMEVMYRDEIQAVLRPKKRERRGGRERIKEE